ncbi:MAG TPA: DUF2179 domain-containing protein [bacterium]|nr:DUF2179 domain-containing protein [Candidatus Omnitrophota bacterium]HOJ61393.1 DUF2179 domain-containing protein [bacterium]HOL95908.1 DUF2179 domain-containing protein [bacterium]HPP02719.1 DUF2179 domain-containing protein [bacterium]HXK92196.1 DUF2179 domain-containing protein [bacterium]
MDITVWIDKEWLPWVFPVIIFCARILDVTVGTLRIIFITRGMRKLAPVLGFIEVFIWLTIVSQVILHVSTLTNFIAYAAGYATGNYIGLLIETKLAIGLIIVRIITQKDAEGLIRHLKANNYGFTNIPAYGNDGYVNVIFTIIKRKNLPDMLNIIQQHNPGAFYSIEDVRSAGEGIFPADREQLKYLKFFRR